MFYHIDFFLPKYNLILEVNGPTHYIFDSEKEVQKYRLKKFHINSLGYKIYDIPFYKLEKAPIDSKGSIFEGIVKDLTLYLSKIK